MWLAGIDLAGKSSNPTPICFYSTKEKGFLIKTAYSDENIKSALEMFKPKIIAIDAPLTLPSQGAFRECEKQLIYRGYRPLSLNLPSMRILHERAKKLLPYLTRYGEVIEVFASSILKELKISKEYAENIFKKKLTNDELDAFACCMGAIHYMQGKYEELGNKEEGIIILPTLI